MDILTNIFVILTYAGAGGIFFGSIAVLLLYKKELTDELKIGIMATGLYGLLYLVIRTDWILSAQYNIIVPGNTLSWYILDATIQLATIIFILFIRKLLKECKYHRVVKFNYLGVTKSSVPPVKI